MGGAEFRRGSTGWEEDGEDGLVCEGVEVHGVYCRDVGDCCGEDDEGHFELFILFFVSFCSSLLYVFFYPPFSCSIAFDCSYMRLWIYFGVR